MANKAHFYILTKEVICMRRVFLSLAELRKEYLNACGFFINTIDVNGIFEFVLILCPRGSNIARQIVNFSCANDSFYLQNSVTCDIIELDDCPSQFIERYRNRKMADVKIVSLAEENQDYSDESLFNITSWGADLSFRELISMYDDDELLKPELQRKYVWTKDEASMFIDSLLLGLPVPSIFLAKENDQKLIIDGYQRIMSVYDYVKGIFSADGKVFKLSNAHSINSKWRGKAFAELSIDEQRRIKSTTIHAIIFEQKHPADDSGMYKVFERINTSGRNLKPQEIRNCVYHGELNNALMEMNSNIYWRKLWGSEASDSRMTDVEFILRFIALDHLLQTDTKLKQISLKKELNSFMENSKSISASEIEQLKTFFNNVVTQIWTLLGSCAFRNLKKAVASDGSVAFASAIHPAIFDAIMLAMAEALRKNKSLVSESVAVSRYIATLQDKEFLSCISQRTTNTDKITTRVDIAKRIFVV